MIDKVEKSDEEWRRQLTPEQYRVARQKGTEAPFTGAHHSPGAIGTFHCVACDLPLFRSSAQFESVFTIGIKFVISSQ